MVTEQYSDILAALAKLTTFQFEALRVSMDMMGVEGTRYPSIATGQPLARRHSDSGKSLSVGTPSAQLKQEDEFEIDERCIEDGLTVVHTDTVSIVINTALIQRYPSLPQHIIEPQPKGVTASLEVDETTATLAEAGLETRGERCSTFTARDSVEKSLDANASAVEVLADDETHSGGAGSLEAVHGSPITPTELGLTPRQGDVLAVLLEGLPNKRIAKCLGLTENTVKEHVSAILLQLGVRTRMQVILRMKDFAMRASQSGDTSDEPNGRALSSEPDVAIPVTPAELGLTQRQGAVLAVLLEGQPNKRIAKRLGLTENTVKEHVSAILRKLGVPSRAQVMLQMNRYRLRLP